METPMKSYLSTKANGCLQGIPGPNEPKTLATKEGTYIVAALDFYVTPTFATQEGLGLERKPNLLGYSFMSTHFELRSHNNKELSGNLEEIAQELIDLDSQGSTFSYNAETENDPQPNYYFVSRSLSAAEIESLETTIKKKLTQMYL